ncbi:ABC transporter ATP-binding protein [Bacillus atrophaeus]|uniref:ABC transporter ATP-binding protein n=1 Tax=Bacillus atrophaeus TaxID=1452 RepID=UPI0022806104|nr:ABC transporter ATP-binding protein [Bacillus atrophaeus]MCY8908113.1 ABC transporter ATP-binding protein [Bacillus atrophaeus]MEC0837998.1 ABC transporter ATP-binding protein [Bacillus atrophaeus]MEC0844126.1 ABC transporter ATP-binding protein [Bacillus atrophaeus]MEC0850616.1 ABC transporter ATP-binding protein [Bacillus atrophaeus]MEC0864358.1 ABC transporter ATP-binding protein [Bacillus atrophaeus]
MDSLSTEQLGIGYGDRLIVEDLNISIPKGKITTLIGPNGCGKSTILKTMSRILRSKTGAVYLNGNGIRQMSTKDIAKDMAILPQTPEAPSGLTVYELVSYGRFPHQSGFGRLQAEDRRIIKQALEETGMAEYHERPIEALSGGQRQRVWIAMALAQGTELLLLDEPTTYLDLAHQLEILQLLEKLNKQQGRTILMVIHDLNHAARFSHYMIALKKGKVIKEGTAEEVMTPDVLKQVFHIDAEIVNDPRTNKPICLTYDLIQHDKVIEHV